MPRQYRMSLTNGINQFKFPLNTHSGSLSFLHFKLKLKSFVFFAGVRAVTCTWGFAGIRSIVISSSVISNAGSWPSPRWFTTTRGTGCPSRVPSTCVSSNPLPSTCCKPIRQSGKSQENIFLFSNRGDEFDGWLASAENWLNAEKLLIILRVGKVQWSADPKLWKISRPKWK